MLEITFSGWIIIGLGILIGFLMIDTNASNKSRQTIYRQINKIIPDPETAKAKDLMMIFVPAIAFVTIVIVYIISL